MRIFPSRLPNVSKRRTSFALLVGTVFALFIIMLGKKYQPPAYPVQPLNPLTDEETQALIDEVLVASIPEDLALELAHPYIEEWKTSDYIQTLGLDQAQQDEVLMRLKANPVDPLVPALVALAKRHDLLGDTPNAKEALEKYLVQYPGAGSMPDCTSLKPPAFEGYVCGQRQAFHRMVMQGSLFAAWLTDERNRHQFGDIWRWAWWRTQSSRRGALYIHPNMPQSTFWTEPPDSFQKDLREASGKEDDYRTPAGLAAFAAPPLLPGVNAVQFLGSGSRDNSIPLESRLFPMESLTCGAVGRTAQTQILPYSKKDAAVLSMCEKELQRRAQAEGVLQQKYAKLISLRDVALHNKNMLQFTSWWTQRKTLNEVEAILDEIAELEPMRLPTFTLVSFGNEDPSQVGEIMNATSDLLAVPPAHTLFAFATHTAAEQENALSVTAVPNLTKGERQWVLAAGTEQSGHLYQRGNVLFVDSAALELLGLSEVATSQPNLWSRCVHMTKQDTPTTWCTEHQWLKLSAAGNSPGRLTQIANSNIEAGEVESTYWLPPGVLFFWGRGVQPGSEIRLEVASTGSAAVTLFEFLAEHPVDPNSTEWVFPSVYGDLR